MPQIPNLPPALEAKAGLEMNSPPPQYLAQTQHVIGDALASLSPDSKGLLTVWVDTTAGVNAALVQKVGQHAEVVAWFGKTWGEPISAGVAGRVRW